MPRKSIKLITALATACLSVVLAAGAVLSQQVSSPSTDTSGASAEAPKEKPDVASLAGTPDADGLIRLAKDYDVWIHREKKEVHVDGSICLREGQLEMFACPKQTKEHESVVVVNSKAFYIHAGLLAIGVLPGKPVSFDPSYQAASGPVIDVLVQWKDDDGEQQRVRAQEWIRDVRTEKPMTHDWVFGGSQFYVDPQTKKRDYLAEYGDFICVSNFPTAMLDVPVESSKDGGSLLFEANTEKIPKLGHKVRLILKPRQAKEKPVEEKPAEEAPAAEEGGKAATTEK